LPSSILTIVEGFIFKSFEILAIEIAAFILAYFIAVPIVLEIVCCFSFSSGAVSINI
jgi:hypothetical protein